MADDSNNARFGGGDDDDDDDDDDEGIPYRFSVEMDENGNVTATGGGWEERKENGNDHDEDHDDDHGEEMKEATGGVEEEKEHDPSFLVVETSTYIRPQQESGGGAGGSLSPPAAGPPPPPHGRSLSPRSWTSRSKPSPKREKLIQSLRGTRLSSPGRPAGGGGGGGGSAAGAAAIAGGVGRGTRSWPATNSGSDSGNVGHNISNGTHHHVSSPTREELAARPQYSPPSSSLPYSTPPRREGDEFVQYKSSMPTDEEDETSENNETTRTNDTNESNEQEYLSAEDTFSDENNNNDIGDENNNHDPTTNHQDNNETDYEETSSTDGQSSEWDVAVKKGKATVIGQAAKDFFATLQPVFSAVTGGAAPAAPPPHATFLQRQQRQIPHPSFTTTDDDDDDEEEEEEEEENDERTTTVVPQQQQLTTPSHSKKKSPTTTSDEDADDDDDDNDRFSTPLMHHYDHNGNIVPSFSQNDDDEEEEEEEEKGAESDLNARPTNSYSRHEGYEHSFEENEDIDDDDDDDDDEEEEEDQDEEYDDDEEDDDEDDDNEEDDEDTTHVARKTGGTTASSSPTGQQRGKGNVVVRVQSSKSAAQDAPSLDTTRELEVQRQPARHYNEEELSAGILPEVFINMRQKIEALSMFDADILKYTANSTDEAREALKRSSQQSISASILVTLTHKRYERRRLASIHIEQVVRSLISEHIEQQKQLQQHQHFKTYTISRELERVRAILLLLSEDYVRSTNEDARKGGEDDYWFSLCFSEDF
jgi:hypothetical protein